MLQIFLGKVIFCILFISFSANTFAQDDESGCKDHPFFNRMPNFYIDKCSDSFREFEFVTSNTQKQTLEGTVFSSTYFVKEGDAKLPSVLQIIKNYEKAILEKGGKKVYSTSQFDDNDFRGGSYELQKDGFAYKICLSNFTNGPDEAIGSYRLEIVKLENMKQELSATDMFDKLNAGKVLALYINFDTGTHTIKSESQSIVDELFKLLTDNSELNILIEGHTDNVGNKASNQVLSEQRAKSVKQSLVDKGIGSKRIKTIGFGQEKPLFDNISDDARSKNRRVEIKKL